MAVPTVTIHATAGPLQVCDSPIAGRGVFAHSRIYAEGDEIERCPLILIPPPQYTAMLETVFYNYVFGWPWRKGWAAMALGFGSLYNHSTQPNAAVSMLEEDGVMIVTATQRIRAGEEILIDYGYDPTGADRKISGSGPAKKSIKKGRQ